MQESKKIAYVQKRSYSNPSTCTCENGKYFESITDDSAITCDEIIDTVRSEPINFNNKKATCKG